MTRVTYRARRVSPRISPLCPFGAAPGLVDAGKDFDQARAVIRALAAKHPFYRYTVERTTVEIIELGEEGG